MVATLKPFHPSNILLLTEAICYTSNSIRTDKTTPYYFLKIIEKFRVQFYKQHISYNKKMMNHYAKLILSFITAAMLIACHAKNAQINMVTPQQYLEHKMENRETPKMKVHWKIQKEDSEYVYYGLKNKDTDEFKAIFKCIKSDLLNQLPCYKEIDGKILGEMLVTRKEFWIGEKLGRNPYMKGDSIKNDTQWEYTIKDTFILITYRCNSIDNLGNHTERIVEIELDKKDIQNRRFNVIKAN